MIVQGSFFSLYRDSYNSEGGVLFKYEKYYLINNENNQTKQADSEKKKFPIYIQILKHSINFIFQGYIGENYYHSELFSLPLSPNLNVSDNLTSVLRSIYFGKLEINKIYYNNTKCKGSEIYFKKEVFLKKTIFYSDFIKNKKEKICVISFRELFLDFLFDLEHSNIFKFSKFYETMEMRLKENTYLNLIASKYLFKFYKELFHIKKGNLYKHKILTKKYLEAAEQWHNLIINVNIENYFDTEWLKNVESEYKDLNFFDVLKTKKLNIKKLSENIKKNQEKNLESNVKQSLLWNLRRYNFLNSYKLVFGKNKKAKIFISVLAFVLVLVFFLSIKFSNLYWDIGILVFLLGIIIKIIVIFNKSVSLMLNILLPRLLVAILSGWILFMATEELWKAWFDISFYYALLPAVAILTTILLFIFYEINNIAVNKIKFRKLMLRAIYLIIIATSYSAIIGIAGSTIMAKKLISNSGYLSEYLSSVKYYPNSDKNNLPDSPWTKDSVIFIKTLYFSNYINKNNKIWTDSSQIFFIKNHKKDSIKIISKLGKKLGLISGEITQINDSTYKDVRTNKKIIKADIDSLYNNDDKLKEYMNRPVSQNLFELMKFINAPKSEMKIFYEHEPVILKHKWTRFKIFPGMLLINTFIAMFFGIFFQLSVQDKTITEPI